MAENIQDFSAANNFLNPVSLMPAESEFDITPGTHSLFGGAVSQDKAKSAQQFINAQLQRLPQENQLRMMQTGAQIERFPLEEKQRAEQLRQEYANLKGKPVRQFVDESAELYGTPEWQRKSPQEKAQSYNTLAATWRAQHEGLDLPPSLSQYTGPETEQHLKDAHDMKRFSTAHQQELEKEKTKGKYTVEASQGRGVDAERIRAAELAARERGEKDQKVKEIRRLNRILLDPKATDEDKGLAESLLEREVEPLIDDKITKRWGNETSALYLPPEQQAMRTKMINEETAKMRKSYGLDKRNQPTAGNPNERVAVIGPDGKEGTLPRHQLEQAKAQGYKVK